MISLQVMSNDEGTLRSHKAAKRTGAYISEWPVTLNHLQAPPRPMSVKLQNNLEKDIVYVCNREETTSSHMQHIWLWRAPQVQPTARKCKGDSCYGLILSQSLETVYALFLHKIFHIPIGKFGQTHLVATCFPRFVSTNSATRPVTWGKQGAYFAVSTKHSQHVCPTSPQNLKELCFCRGPLIWMLNKLERPVNAGKQGNHKVMSRAHEDHTCMSSDEDSFVATKWRKHLDLHKYWQVRHMISKRVGSPYRWSHKSW